jgi:hypothetical protein
VQESSVQRVSRGTAPPDPAALLADAHAQRSRARRWVTISAVAVVALATGTALGAAAGDLRAPAAILAAVLIAINLGRLGASAVALVRIRRAMALIGLAVAAASELTNREGQS